MSVALFVVVVVWGVIELHLELLPIIRFATDLRAVRVRWLDDDSMWC